MREVDNRILRVRLSLKSSDSAETNASNVSRRRPPQGRRRHPQQFGHRRRRLLHPVVPTADTVAQGLLDLGMGGRTGFEKPSPAIASSSTRTSNLQQRQRQFADARGVFGSVACNRVAISSADSAVTPSYALSRGRYASTEAVRARRGPDRPPQRTRIHRVEHLLAAARQVGGAEPEQFHQWNQ